MKRKLKPKKKVKEMLLFIIVALVITTLLYAAATINQTREEHDLTFCEAIQYLIENRQNNY